MSHRSNRRAQDLLARLENWLEGQYGRPALTVAEPVDRLPQAQDVSAVRESASSPGIPVQTGNGMSAPRSASERRFAWKELHHAQPGLPAAVGIRAVDGHPSCYEFVESLHGGRHRRTYWSFDVRAGWKLLLDV